MSMGVTIVRHEGTKIPDEFLAKALEKYSSCVGFSVASSDGSKIVLRKHVGTMTLEEAKKFLGHEALKKRTVTIFIGGNEAKAPEDVQPYPVLTNGEGNVLVSAFLNGDFLHFSETDSDYPAEYFCLQKQIIPRVAKAFKIGDQDLVKLVEELKDPVYANDWANLMAGQTGSITLMIANGDVHTFLVEGETISKDNSGWWTSDSLEDEQPQVVEEQDDLEKELGDVPAAPAKPATQVATPPKPKGTLSMPSRPIASTAAVVATPKPTSGAGPVSPSAASALTNMNAVLTLMIPPGMDAKRMLKWATKRMPDSWKPPAVLSGLKILTCKRSEATTAFIQEYCQQNNLGSLADVMATATSIKEAAKSSTAVGHVASPPPKAAMAQPTKEGEYPAKSEASQSTGSKGKDTSPHHVGVVAGPVPVFSPEQLKQLTEFTNTSDFKAAFDKHGKIIAAPGGADKFEQMFDNMYKQTDGKITPANVAMWPYEQHLAWIEKADKKSVATVQFWLGLELLKATHMLDELTEPHRTTKKQEEPAQQPQQTAQAGSRRPAMPSVRKAS